MGKKKNSSNNPKGQKGSTKTSTTTTTTMTQLSARVQLCIVGNGANANPAAVAVITDRETLLFNCGEGVQRLLTEHKIRVGKIKHVLFTSLRPESFAGFFGPAFVILECPTLNHTHSLFESFEEVLDEEEGRLLGGRELRLVVHIAPQHVFASPHYQRWLKEGFGRHAAVKHIPLDADNRSEPCLITSSSARVKLNAVDGTIFRALSEQAPPEIIETLAARQTVLPDAPTMLTYTFRPAREQPFSFSPASCRVKTAEEILSTTLEVADFAANLAEYHTAISKTSAKESTSKLSSSPKFKPNVLFLGTASALPGKQRNTSAILVNIPVPFLFFRSSSLLSF
ncbi:Zinc phosphodiesterase ELAC protein 2 [Tyrophagus putrescentiae]|nr:Zinc phosphodiesterase ELAC protein 2 [Tyrophagus putrescentiae]